MAWPRGKKHVVTSRMNFFILSGCSGGGKSTLLSELEKRAYPVVPEAGRRVVAEALSTGSGCLPWMSPLSFVRACVRLHLEDLDRIGKTKGPVFLDRSLVDVISYLDFKQLPVPDDLKTVLEAPRYAPKVFLAPPWPEIFATDCERQAPFEEAENEYRHLRRAFSGLGFELIDLPKCPVKDRADFVEEYLARVQP